METGGADGREHSFGPGTRRIRTTASDPVGNIKQLRQTRFPYVGRQRCGQRQEIRPSQRDIQFPRRQETTTSWTKNQPTTVNEKQSPHDSLPSTWPSEKTFSLSGIKKQLSRRKRKERSRSREGWTGFRDSIVFWKNPYRGLRLAKGPGKTVLDKILPCILGGLRRHLLYSGKMGTHRSFTTILATRFLGRGGGTEIFLTQFERELEIREDGVDISLSGL